VHRILLAVVLVVASGAMLASAEESAPEPPLRYRRVYAPADDVKNWPRGNERYIPVDPEEFERLIELARGTSAAVGPGSMARLEAAMFHTRLSDDKSLHGTALLQIVAPDDAPTSFRLSPCGLAINSLEWSHDRRPATLSADGRGDTKLAVPQSDDLKLAWSLGAARQDGEASTFDFSFPGAPEHTLIIELPERLAATTDLGLASESPAEEKGWRAWRLDLGGASQFSVRIAPRESSTSPRPRAFLRTQTTYEVSSRGLDINAQWKLDVQQPGLRQIELAIDPAMELVSVKLGDAPCRWTLFAMPNNAAKRVVVELPEDVSTGQRTLRLTALAPLVTDNAARLPRLVPADLAWEEGTITLLVPATFAMKRLSGLACRQSKAKRLAAPLLGESIELQCFGPEATAEIVIARERERPRLAVGTSLVLGTASCSGRIVADFELPSGERFNLRGKIADDWTVESVQTVPSDALGDWNVETSEAARRRLSLRLAKALSPVQPVRVIVALRAHGIALGEVLRAADTHIFRFDDAVLISDLLALAANADHQVRVDGAEAVLLNPKRLSEAEHALVGAMPAEVVFDRSRIDSIWRVQLERARPEFTAEAQVDAMVVGDTLHESYTVTITPGATPLDRVTIQLTTVRDNPLEWSLAGRATAIAAAQPPETAHDGNAKSGGQTWELRFHKPQSDAFELHARRTSAMRPGVATPIGLMALPDAVQQSGRVCVYNHGAAGVAIRNRGLVESWPDGSHGSEMVAAFRYEPLRELARASNEALAITRRTDAASLDGAVVLSESVDSRYESTGRSTHWGRLRLHNLALNRLQLRLPERAELQGLWLDGHPATLDGGMLPLGAAEFPELVVALVTSDARFASATKRFAPTIDVGLPVLDRQWTFWLPPGYEVLDGPQRAPPTWSARFFGSLSRGAQRQPFDPLSADDWIGMVSIVPARRDATLRLGEVLAELGQALAPAASGSRPRTWGELIAVAEAATSRHDFILLVDPQALAQAGFDADSPLPPLATVDDEATPTSRGGALLWQAGFVFMTDGSHLALTTSAAAELEHSAVSPLAEIAAYWIDRGALRNRLHAATQHHSDRFVAAADWRKNGAANNSAKRVHPSGLFEPVGWMGHHLSLADGRPAITIVPTALVQVWSWAALLAAAGIALWLSRVRPRAVAAIILVAGIAALVAPAWMIAITSAAFLGTLIGSLGLLRPPARISLPTLPSMAEPLRIGAVMLALALFAEQSFAVEPAAPPPTTVNAAPPTKSAVPSTPPSAPVRTPAIDYRVFIPSDDQGTPTGGRYFVPEEFYSALRQRALATKGNLRSWTLNAASYRAVLASDPGKMGMEVTEFVVALDVTIDDPETIVYLPLGREAVGQQPVRMLVDGRSTQVAWNDAAQALEWLPAEAGNQRLEIFLRPLLRYFPDGAGFDLAVPTLLTSQLEVILPADAPDLTVPCALGEVRRSDDRQTVTAQLGNCGRVSLRWHDARAAVTAPAAIDVDELLWLKVRPGSVLLDVRLSLKIPPGGSVREIQLLADSRLRPLAAGSSTASISELPMPSDHASLGDARRWSVTLARPATESITVPVSLQYADFTGVGRLRLPRIEVLSARSIRRWLAVSVDSSLNFDVHGRDAMSEISPASLAAHWGPEAAAPQLAYELTSGVAAWRLDTHPKPAKTSARQSLTVTAGATRLGLEYEAEITTEAAHVFQHRLSVPQGFDVESVSLLEDGAERAEHWAKDGADTVTVFLSDPVIGAQTLSLRGSLNVAVDAPVNLPLVMLQGVPATGTTISLVRQQAATVAVDEIVGLSPDAESAKADKYPERGRTVGRWLVSGDAPSARLTITPNVPRVRCEQVVTMARDEQGWRAVADIRWHVTSGLLDVLRLEIPPGWRGPFQITPAATSEVVELPGQNRSQLVIYPRAAVRDSLQTVISGPVAAGQGESITVPNILPVHVDKRQRYVRLPIQLGLQQAAWQTVNLRLAQLPAELEQPAAPLQYETYHVLRDQASATLNTLERVVAIPVLRLADARVACAIDGSYRGTIGFDVEMVETTPCVLQVPANCTIDQALVNGHLATLLPEGPDQWRVPTIRSTLPQHIEMVFTGTARAVSRWRGTATLDVPSLVNLTAEHALWTVAIAGQRRAAIRGVGSLGPIALDLVHLQSIVDAVSRPEDELSALPAEERLRWFAAWRIRWLSVRERIDADSPDNGYGLIGAEGKTNVLDRRWSEVSLRIDPAAATLRPNEARQQRSAEEQGFPSPSGATVRCAVEGSLPSVTVEWRSNETSDATWRYAAAAGVLLAGVVGLLLARRGYPVPGEWLQRWPQMAVALAGIAWWLWLEPSFLGLAIIVGAALAAARSVLRPAPEAGIRVVRSNITTH
jgi:hypothetical protein